jgi:hypothetical protein
MLMVVPSALLLNRSTRVAYAQQTAVQLALALRVPQTNATNAANQVPQL